MRGLRLLVLSGLFFFLATNVPPPPPRPPRGPSVARLAATPILLDDNDPGRRRAGALVFVRGWHLTSPEPRFGGISAMNIERGRVIALSDAGVVIRFALPGESNDRQVSFLPLPRGPGPATRKSNRDSESLFVRDGHAWVGFERKNMIWRYDRTRWTAQAAVRPRGMRRWEGNSGAETLVGLNDGRFLAIAEGDADTGFSDALLFDGDPTLPATRAVALRYRHVPGMRPTDSASLPDGRLLVLNRSASLFGGLAAALVIVEADQLRAGRMIEGREIARLRSPLAVDNMEALSVAREGDRTMVRIASDDNFFPLQKTLLLEFVLDERALRRSQSPTASSRLRALGDAPSG